MTVYLTVKTADMCKTTTSAATNTCPAGLKTWGFLQYLLPRYAKSQVLNHQINNAS